jgi:hypothetical protein
VQFRGLVPAQNGGIEGEPALARQGSEENVERNARKSPDSTFPPLSEGNVEFA